ncbi:helix-turn-helix domain-containing protein [Nitrogeniibacter mangrovi]|uniref:Helix-turn-helix domain-containing protein n=1 Tax=Nitrogeniibacter mangrovi TaxID=2016596 RepID=A0A6C1B1N7_9RHOO|nr:helix-turn-helix domain-containing protein [Nitrogeniibacter mangrovi]QID17536.1 helix-turn-helix domain-containing protein [Nitrogeniibacter mangrovi]
MRHVTLVLVRNNYASTTLAPQEIFLSAGRLWEQLHGEDEAGRFEVSVVTVDGRPVASCHGVGITPHGGIHDIEHTDVIILSSSGLDVDEELAYHQALYPWLRHHHRQGAYVGSICTGAAFLAEAGLLDARRATTHWAIVSRYARRFPAVHWHADELITEDDRLLTCGGVHAGLDMSLYLVEKFCGHEVALQCARALVLDLPRTHQSGYAILPLSRPHQDERIREVEAFICARYADDLSVEQLAGKALMSPRTFMRRFKAATGRLPGNYLQARRIAVARELLEAGAQSIREVSDRVGYEDLAYFRKLFKRETGMTPAEYRRRFPAALDALAPG